MTMSKAEKLKHAAAAATKSSVKSEPEATKIEAAAPSPEKATGPKISPAASSDIDASLGRKIQAPTVHDNEPAGGGRTVVIACKIPRGLYLQLTEFVDQDVKVVGGGVEKRRMPMRVGGMVRIKPSVLPFGAIPNYPIVEGFSLTRNVDANFWRGFYEQNKNLEMITSGLLCAFDNEADATAYCREYGKLKHGLEALEKTGDPRVEKMFNPNLTDIDIDTDAKPATR